MLLLPSLLHDIPSGISNSRGDVLGANVALGELLFVYGGHGWDSQHREGLPINYIGTTNFVDLG